MKTFCHISTFSRLIRKVSTIFRRLASWRARWADSRPLKRPLKKVRTLIKSPGRRADHANQALLDQLCGAQHSVPQVQGPHRRGGWKVMRRGCRDGQRLSLRIPRQAPPAQATRRREPANHVRSNLAQRRALRRGRRRVAPRPYQQAQPPLQLHAWENENREQARRPRCDPPPRRHEDDGGPQGATETRPLRKEAEARFRSDSRQSSHHLIDTVSTLFNGRPPL
jgi:hypothetical protein